MIFPPAELKKLPKIRDLVRWLNTLRSYALQSTPLPGQRCDVYPGSDGTVIDPILPGISRGGSATASDPKPFQILSSGENVGVAPFSTLFKNINGDKLPITGLLTDPTDPSDPGWFACPAIGEKIWLQIGTSDPAHTDAGPQPWAATTTIQHGAAGSSLWDEYPDPISATGSPAYQEFYNLLIAEVTDPESDPRPAILTVTIGTGEAAQKRQITQCWSRNLTLVFWVVNGLLCLVPTDPALDFQPSA